MSTIQLLIICVSAIVFAAIVWGDRARSDEPELAAVGSVVQLHLGDDQSVRGTVIDGPEGFVSLVEVSLIAPGSETKMAGTARVARASITLAQEV